MKTRFPLLANLDGVVKELIKGVEVRVHGKPTKSPAVIRYSLTNEGRELIAASDMDPLSLQFRRSQFRHAHASIRRQLDRRHEIKEDLTVNMNRHELRLESVKLAPGDMLNIDMIVGGPGDDLNLKSPVPVVEQFSLIPGPDAHCLWILTTTRA